MQALEGLGRSKEIELIRAAKNVSASENAAEESKVAKSFETYFTMMLVKEMRKALPQGFFSGAGSDIYGAWFDEHIAESLSSRDALGFAGMIKTALERSASTDAMELESVQAEPGADENEKTSGMKREDSVP